MGETIYHLKSYVAEQQSTIANFPIAIKEMPPGQQAERLWHMHDSMELVLVTAGSGVHFLNGESAFIRTGDVLVVYPGLQHGYANCENLGLVNILYDNSKLLDVTGLKQEQFISLYDGLKHEIDRTPRDYPFPNNQFMDDYLKKLLP